MERRTLPQTEKRKLFAESVAPKRQPPMRESKECDLLQLAFYNLQRLKIKESLFGSIHVPEVTVSLRNDKRRIGSARLIRERQLADRDELKRAQSVKMDSRGIVSDIDRATSQGTQKTSSWDKKLLWLEKERLERKKLIKILQRPATQDIELVVDGKNDEREEAIDKNGGIGDTIPAKRNTRIQNPLQYRKTNCRQKRLFRQLPVPKSTTTIADSKVELSISSIQLMKKKSPSKCTNIEYRQMNNRSDSIECELQIQFTPILAPWEAEQIE
jgi:hypothetical protein